MKHNNGHDGKFTARLKVLFEPAMLDAFREYTQRRKGTMASVIRRHIRALLEKEARDRGAGARKRKEPVGGKKN